MCPKSKNEFPIQFESNAIQSSDFRTLWTNFTVKLPSYMTYLQISNQAAREIKRDIRLLALVWQLRWIRPAAEQGLWAGDSNLDVEKHENGNLIWGLQIVGR